MSPDAQRDLTYPARLRRLSIPLARGVPCIAGDWNVLLESRVIGRGAEQFSRARERILSWQMHQGAGIRVRADGDVAVGRRVTLSVGVGPLLIPANCEVVEVVNEPRETGFAYGTLTRHPECGEEAFLVRWRGDDAVVGSVAAFSRPAAWYTKAGGPVTSAVQSLAARRYLAAMLPGCDRT